jgi:aspartate/methionine/tyrosine aminotransferase
MLERSEKEEPMRIRRLEHIPGFSIDRVAAAAGDDPDVLRLENLDTDIPPPAAAMDATRAAIGEDQANSWLPFTGRDDLKEAVAAYIERRGGPRYDGRREIVITSGEGDAMLDALFCLTDPGDEVILTDPTYAGMLNRVRAGAWSLLLDVAALGLDCIEVSDRLLEQKVAATPMRGWGGEIADRHVRFVFSNEPVDRLALLGTRVQAALAAAGERT